MYNDNNATTDQSKEFQKAAWYYIKNNFSNMLQYLNSQKTIDNLQNVYFPGTGFIEKHRRAEILALNTDDICSAEELWEIIPYWTAINYYPGLTIVLRFKPIESLRLHRESSPYNWVNAVK